MKPIKYISIFLLSSLFLATGFSCSMGNQEPGWNDRNEYVNAYLTIGGTVYCDAGDGEYFKVGGLQVLIKGTSGITVTNQHGYFIINTTKSINRSNLDESVVIEVSDIDGSAGEGHFATRNITFNIGRLVEWSDAAGAFVAKNDPSKLSIYVDKSPE